MKTGIALVTGASSGIGEATANRLAKAGYKVYGTSRRGAQAGQRTFEMLPLDVTSDASVEAAVKEVLRLHARIDLLVNNAGFGVAPAAAEESSLDQARAIFDTNFFGIIRMTRAVLPHMRQQGCGRIINIGSVLGFLPMPYMALYSATKHAVAGYSESLDHELRTMGIRVSVIEPAYIKTPFDSNFMAPDAPPSTSIATCARPSISESRRWSRALTVLRLWPKPYCRPPSRRGRNSAMQPVGSPDVCACYADLRPRAWWTPVFAKICGSQRRRYYFTQRESDKEQGTMMKAFVVDRYGRKNGVRAGEMPVPELREDDVLVQIHAAGVNPLDSKIRDGEFKLILPYRLPLILGNDFSGVVVRVGSRVRRFKPGDEVYARPHKDRIGTFTEFIAIKEDAVALKPKALTMEEAASIPLVGLTAWQALVERGQLKKGQKVLIHAGSGGVGTFAIQLAKHLGATVATTASAANAGLMKQLGADIVIDYKKDDFAAVLKDCDVVLDTQGGNTLEKSLQVLKPGGKLIGIAGPPDPDFAKQIGASWLLKTAMRFLSYRIRKAARRRDVGYSFLFMRADGDQLAQIAKLVDAAAIRPVIDRIFPFESTREALAYVETGRAKGKVVIKIR